MTVSKGLPVEPVTLNNCDREPIHVPGLIQPHGILLALTEPDWIVVRVSANTQSILGLAPQSLLGKSMATFLPTEAWVALKQCLQQEFEQVNPVPIQVIAPAGAVSFSAILHRSPQGQLILELEPQWEVEEPSFQQFYHLTRSTLARLQQAPTLEALCQRGVAEIRQIIGFDRVMIYRFAPDGSGTVVAEDKAPDLESYLGLHYPDSDIPRQAKHLYTLNPLRLIPDVEYEPVAILSQESESSGPLDLSFSTLRSVSPIHIEYLKNMGVGASLSVSLLKNGSLWGLVACHHRSSKGVSYLLRSVCEFLGQVMSLELIAKEENEHLDYKVRLRSIQARFVETISRADNLVEALADNRDDLLGVVGAVGAALCLGGQLTLMGQTPPESEIYPLLDWLQDRFQDNLFVTDSLPQQYPPIAPHREVASGLLALSISKIQKDAVLWFRPEILQQVNWAGNPDKPKRLEADGSLTIFPRKSFALWQETVRLKSLPWQPWEVDGALELRSAIVGIVLKRADELAALNLELARTNIELDAFAYIASHDLKEPLRGIHNYSTFLLEDYAQILDQEGVSKLETLVNLTKRMEDLINSLLHFSRLGRQELHLYPIDFNQLVNNVKGILEMSLPDEDMDIRVPRPLPTLQGDRVLMEEVLTNLISNGIKYNDQPHKWVEIGFQEPQLLDPLNPTPFWTFYVRDNGIGIRVKHLDNIFRIFKRLHASGKYGGGTGAGLTIVRKIIERHGGQIWVESVYGEGSTFYFTLPA